MHTISGTLKNTPTQWFPVLSNIPPPYLRLKAALKRERLLCTPNRQLPVHEDLAYRNRLGSRHIPCGLGESLYLTNFHFEQAWREEWNTSNPYSKVIIVDPQTNSSIESS